MKPLLIAICSAFLFTGCLFGGEDDSDTTPSGPVANKPLADRIAGIQQGLSDLRGMPFTRALHSAVITPEFFKKQVEANVGESINDQTDRAVSRELAQLGFFKDTLGSIKKDWTEFYGSFPAGYYVPGRDSIYILSNYVQNEPFLRVALPHELVHALQDQAFNAFDRNRPVGLPGYYAGDFYQARNCLIEGDAEFTAYAYYARHHEGNPEPFLFSREEALRRKNGYTRWQQTPDDQRLFAPNTSPYDLGMRYVADQYDRGGYPSVDSLYALNAQTTLTTLTNLTLPAEPIDLDWLPGLLDTNGAFVDDFGGGSLHLLSYLASDPMTEEAFNKGRGWRGDRLFYRRHLADRWGALVWVQTYVDSLHAKGAFLSTETVLSKRFMGPSGLPYSHVTTSFPGSWDRAIAKEGAGLQSILIQAGREVWQIEGTGDRTDAIIETLKRRILPVTEVTNPPRKDPDITKGLLRVSAGTARKSRLLGPDLGMRFLHAWPRDRK